MAASTDWPTYHLDNTRAGNDTNTPPITGLSPQWTSIHLDGNAWGDDIYAEPLVVGSRVIVATQGDTVYSLDATTGAVQWSINVGTPARSSEVGCGPQDPIGIQSTPTVDVASGTVYAVALVNIGTSTAPNLQFHMIGLDINTGTRKFNDLPITPAGLDPYYQGERGALAFSAAAGKVYIPFGGRDGDCQPYHGYLVAAPASGSGALTVFNDQAPMPAPFPSAPNGASEAGFWASAGPAIDGAGNVYVTSGNGSDTGTFDYGETVFRLNASLQIQDFFAPTNWASLNQGDTDLGSTGPAIVGASSNMIFQIGKSGRGYLLSTSQLSANANHIGGELFSASVCGSMAFGGVAYADPYIYVGCLNGLHAVKLNGASFTVPWSVTTTRYGPPIVSGGIVWAAQIDNGILDGFDPTTGTRKFSVNVASFNGNHFATPAASAGRIFVGASNQVFAYGQVAGQYHPLAPTRILDTRNGNGGYSTPVAAHTAITLQVTGRGNVPATGVSAVVLNTTVTNTLRPGWLTVYPTGTSLPVASNLNWAQSQTVPNLVETAVGSSGRVDFYNGSDASTNVVADVEGWVAIPSPSPTPDGYYNPVVPARVLDTRYGPYPVGQNSAAPMTQGQTIQVQVTGNGGVPAASEVEAVVLNVTAANPSTYSYLTVFPGGTVPLASNLNFAPNQTIPNRVIVPVDATGRVSIYNGFGTVNVVVDVGGWFTSSTSAAGGSQYTAVSPSRILDTRNGTGGFSAPIGPSQTIAVTVAGVGGVPSMTAPNAPKAVVLNVTATGCTTYSYLTVWPTGGSSTPPTASDLNYPPYSNNPNLVVVKIGPDGKVNMFNGLGSVNVVADVEGWYS